MGQFTRPNMQVLPDSAMVPADNTLHPAPSDFSHKVTTPQPYYFQPPAQGASPAGQFAAGEHLLMLSHEGGAWCRVANEKGLSVFTTFATLDPL